MLSRVTIASNIARRVAAGTKVWLAHTVKNAPAASSWIA